MKKIKTKNGGRIMNPVEIQSIIGREAFFEAMKITDRSFKVVLNTTATLEAIEE